MESLTKPISRKYSDLILKKSRKKSWKKLRTESDQGAPKEQQEDEKEKEVERAEGAEHAGLQNEEEDHVAGDALLGEVRVVGVVEPAPPGDRGDRRNEEDGGGE